MGWKEKEYSKNQINKAGRKIISDNLIDDEKNTSVENY